MVAAALQTPLLCSTGAVFLHEPVYIWHDHALEILDLVLNTVRILTQHQSGSDGLPPPVTLI